MTYDEIIAEIDEREARQARICRHCGHRAVVHGSELGAKACIAYDFHAHRECGCSVRYETLTS